ncbi:reverse transcriptase domain-containing protein, partial [Stenotrophomonas sp. SY1]|uniref:reverse transcriptase domain-containing protein n=1 Tax=Stenotrophomonas sp. SY1 TaxID=477235 RepID=UPI001E3EB34C
MRVVIRDQHSKWNEVISGVPQGTVLAPIMFAIYINDMDEGIESYMSFFADDAKLLRVKTEEDCESLQRDLNKVQEWSRKWEMEFNTKKCSIMEFGKSKNRITGAYKLGEEGIKKVENEKDLGVIVMNNMSPEKQINKIFGETYDLIRTIKVALTYLDEEMVKKILITLIRPRLEYA